jgi:hypothetical protein
MKSGDLVAYKDDLDKPQTGVVGATQVKDGGVIAIHVNGNWLAVTPAHEISVIPPAKPVAEEPAPKKPAKGGK